VQRELRSGQPELHVPWIGGKLPDGLEPDVNINRWAQPLLRRNEGFQIQGLTAPSRSLFPSFFDEPVNLLPKARVVVRKDKSGQPAEYWEYQLDRTFTARSIDSLTFGPVTLEGAFVTDVDEGGSAEVEEIYAVAKAIEVTVKDVPEKGRPDTYVGAVGRFELAASLAPTKVKVGDPMTLTLSLSGQGTLEEASAPEVARMAEIAERFKIHEPTEDRKPGSARFTYSVRPQKEGIEAFPPVAVSYFDVESERYVTLRTDPIPVEVSATEWLSGDQIVAGSGGPAAGRKELEVRREGIFANVTDAAAVCDESVRPLRWLLGLGGIAGLYVATALVTLRLQRRSADKALLRRRGAVKKAWRRLHRAQAEIDARRPRYAADHVQSAIVGLVADVADLAEAGLTPKEVGTELENLGVADGLVRRTADLLETCDAARYGTALGADGLGHEARQVVDELTKSLKANKRFR
jgi:hypothetical protein